MQLILVGLRCIQEEGTETKPLHYKIWVQLLFKMWAVSIQHDEDEA